jgi:hypothetical protein
VAKFALPFFSRKAQALLIIAELSLCRYKSPFFLFSPFHKGGTRGIFFFFYFSLYQREIKRDLFVF